ncbi:MAG: CpsD/CapB family tyrosine-protein kinase [Eubacteriales bacterium]|nr:CpsD/CapB family tyrosine-protein kinase [Eubacteriales bacterium]
MRKYHRIKTLIETIRQKGAANPNEARRKLNTILSDDTPFVIRENYKTARTNIIFSVSGTNKTGCKFIAITSANPGEGKTTTTLNLAITFAQTGARVLAIDGDLRKPRMHRYLNLKKDIGLSSVLSNQMEFEKAVNRNVRYGLDVLSSGEIPPNPAELLCSEAMKQLIEKLSNEYDYVLFDTPPVTVVTDAAALSPLVDGVIIIIRQNYTDHESLTMAVNLLNIARTKILGFFVNDVTKTRGGYSYSRYRYKYGSKYSYRYGYRYDYRYGYADRKKYEQENIEETRNKKQ